MVGLVGAAILLRWRRRRGHGDLVDVVVAALGRIAAGARLRVRCGFALTEEPVPSLGGFANQDADDGLIQRTIGVTFEVIDVAVRVVVVMAVLLTSEGLLERRVAGIARVKWRIE